MPNRVKVLTVSDADRVELARRVRAKGSAARDVERARIVLLAADGVPGKAIAARVGCAEPTVVMWRSRFAERGLAGLPDRGASASPARPRSANRERHITTVGSAQPTRAAICLPGTPSAASSTIRARSTSRAGEPFARTRRASSARSPSQTVNTLTRFGMLPVSHQKHQKLMRHATRSRPRAHRRTRLVGTVARPSCPRCTQVEVYRASTDDTNRIRDPDRTTRRRGRGRPEGDPSPGRRAVASGMTRTDPVVLHTADFPAWLTVLSVISLTVAIALAGWTAVDVARRPQRMRVMAVVWPVVMLFGGVLWLRLYLRWGRRATSTAVHPARAMATVSDMTLRTVNQAGKSAVCRTTGSVRVMPLATARRPGEGSPSGRPRPRRRVVRSGSRMRFVSSVEARYTSTCVHLGQLGRATVPTSRVRRWARGRDLVACRISF